MSSAAPVPRGPALPRGISVDRAEALSAADQALLRQEIGVLLARAAHIRGAYVYPIAHGAVVVRLIAGRGWIPVVLGPADRRDAAVLGARLRAAAGRCH